MKVVSDGALNSYSFANGMKFQAFKTSELEFPFEFPFCQPPLIKSHIGFIAGGFFEVFIPIGQEAFVPSEVSTILVGN